MRGLPAADSQLTMELRAAVERLIREIRRAGWPVDSIAVELAGRIAEGGDCRELVRRSATRIVGPAAAAGDGADRVASATGEFEATLRRLRPQLAEELVHRVRPLREQWEARGPGLLRMIRQLVEDAILCESAEVVLVSPYVGGYGWVHPDSDRVLLEAVLFNPSPELPEVLRLGWLLCQLNVNSAQCGTLAPAPTARDLVELAMIPPTLAAAQHVELAACSQATFAAALEAWRVGNVRSADVAATLWHWWSDVTAQSIQWPDALNALDRMLSR